jgi:hemolysin III
LFPNYSRAELIADGAIHVIGVTAGIAAAACLVAVAITQLSAGAAAAVIIYCAGMLAVFCFSAAYNLSRGPRRWLLQRCDHAAIYVKIAATYTPFAALKLGGLAGFGLLGAVWGIAVLGAAAKLIMPAHFVRTSYVLYLAQGWVGILAAQPLLAALSTTALVLLLAGGVLYTVGVVFHLWSRLPYHNAIWHGCVLVASACHFGAVLDAVVLT